MPQAISSPEETNDPEDDDNIGSHVPSVRISEVRLQC
jgi:hypothetical protein